MRAVHSPRANGCPIGQHAHVFVVDEGGAIADLDFIVREIALPALDALPIPFLC